MKNFKRFLFVTILMSSSLCYSFSITPGRQQKVNDFISNILHNQGAPSEIIATTSEGKNTIGLYVQRVVIDIKPYSGNTNFSLANLPEETMAAINAEAKRGRKLVEVYNSGDVVDDNLRFVQSYDMSKPSNHFVGSPLKLVTLSSNEQSRLEEIFFDTLPKIKSDNWFDTKTRIGKSFERYILMEDARFLLKKYAGIESNSEEDTHLVIRAMEMAIEDLKTPGTIAYGKAVSALVRPESAYLMKAVGACYDNTVFDNYIIEFSRSITEVATLSVSDAMMKIEAMRLKLEEFKEFNNRKMLGK